MSTAARLGALALALCLAWPAAAGAAQPAALTVAVPVAPMAWLARQVGGPRVAVLTVVPPGVDPHSYAPSPRGLARLDAARLYLCLDLPFERRLAAKLAAGHGGIRLVDATAGIKPIILGGGSELTDLARQANKPQLPHRGRISLRLSEPTGGRPGSHPEPDPHIWLSPRRFSKMAANLAAAFRAADPAGGPEYQARLGKVQVLLAGLDMRLAAILRPVKGHRFLVVHPAFTYLAADYGLKQVAIEQEGKSPGARSLSSLMGLVESSGARVIFAERGFPERAARALSKATKAKIVVLDPLAQDYAANLEAMARKIAAGIKGHKK